MMRRLNEVRHENVALQHLSNVFWLDAGNENIFAYAKIERGNAIIVVCNLDPHHTQAGALTIPAHLGLAPVFVVEDQFTGWHFDWRIGQNYVELDPHYVGKQFHLLKVL